MSSGKNRKRLEVSQELYYALERRAGWLHMPTARLAEMLLWESLNASEQRAPSSAVSPRSAMAGQIVAEGSPSPTLAVLQREALGGG